MLTERCGVINLNLKDRAKRLKSEVPAVFLSLKDKKTPIIAKLFAGLTVAYALSPIDLIPDFIPILGYLDDLIILPMLVALTIKFIPAEIWQKNLILASNIWKNGKPKKWYYSIPIILVWIIIIWIIVKCIFIN